MKTILKLHANGNFEHTNTPLYQDKNLFVMADSSPGMINGSGDYVETDYQNVRVSDFMPIIPGEVYAAQVSWPNDGIYRWICGFFYDRNRQPIGSRFEAELQSNFETSMAMMADASYIRVCASYLNGSYGTTIQFERGGNATTYAPALKDIIGRDFSGLSFSEDMIITPPIIVYKDDLTMPSWVKDTGNPISFFKEGIVIKGELLQTNN